MSARPQISGRVLDESSPEAQKLLAQIDPETMESRSLQQWREFMRQSQEQTRLKSAPSRPDEKPSTTNG